MGRLPAPPVSGGFGYPLGAAAALPITIVSVAAGATTHPWAALVALAVEAVVIATVTTLLASLATAAVQWCLHAGFVLGRRGDLQFSAESARAAALLGAVALLAYLASASVRHRQAGHQEVAIPEQRRPTTARSVRSSPA